ncbi:MAG: hypothetical protein ABI398_01710 [Devosia sp.]
MIDGNYSAMDGKASPLMPQRLARATGIILLGGSRWASLARYFRRTLIERERAGALAGNRDSVKWAMIRWIMVNSPANLRRYRRHLPKTGLAFLELRGMRGLRGLYASWGLDR